jgi:hypothetical protein
VAESPSEMEINYISTEMAGQENFFGFCPEI